MVTDVYPAIQQSPAEVAIRPESFDGLRVDHHASRWSLAFYALVVLAVVLASWRAVWPPDEARLDPSITQVQ